jgi:hypothetical protein
MELECYSASIMDTVYYKRCMLHGCRRLQVDHDSNHRGCDHHGGFHERLDLVANIRHSLGNIRHGLGNIRHGLVNIRHV